MLTSEVHGLYTGAEGAGEMAGGRDGKIRERQDENPYRGLRSSPKHTLPPHRRSRGQQKSFYFQRVYIF